MTCGPEIMYILTSNEMASQAYASNCDNQCAAYIYLKMCFFVIR
jgi:hypothetical protein